MILAQDAAQVIFEKANENYRNEKYEVAAQQYESILQDQKVASAELYYNL
jgi:F0F1-type ATP synthase delta subunit